MTDKRLSGERLEAIRSRITGSDAGPWAPDYTLAKECGGRTAGSMLLDHIAAIEAELAEARRKLGNSNASWISERSRLALAEAVVEAAKRAAEFLPGGSTIAPGRSAHVDASVALREVIAAYDKTKGETE